MIRGVVSAIAVAALSAGTARAEEEDGWARPGYQRVLHSRALRPLTTPKRTFDVFVLSSLTTASRTREVFLRVPLEERGDAPVLGVEVGSLFGLANDLELGVTLPPMRFVDGIQFAGPSLEVTWLALDAGDFQLGLTGASILPIVAGFSFEGRVPMQLRVGESLRLEARPSIAVMLGDKHEYAVANLPIGATLQLAELWFARLETGASTLGFETLAVKLGAELGATIPGDYGAFADVLLGFGFPSLVDASAGAKLNVEHWQLTLGARFYVRLPQDRGDPGGDF